MNIRNFDRAAGERLMLALLEPLLPLYTAEKTGIDIGATGATYDAVTMGLEAFSRPMWALGPFWAGGGRHPGFEETYRQGLRNGANPQSAGCWGGFRDYDQRFVEMAAMACSLILAPEIVWTPLRETEQARLANWLYAINTHEIPENNWLFFRVLVNVALEKRGRRHDPDRLAADLERLDSFYLGGGWYQDGGNGQKDYYVSFGMHYYGLLYAAFMGEADPQRSAAYRARAASFAHDFIYWFAEDGAALPYGRSLSYRFAQCSFWSACLFAGIEPFPVPVMKGIILRNLRYFLDRPIRDRNGVLTIGYGYPNLIMSEQYNAPGSPYWGMKAFLFLALPDAHPFWTAEAAPLPGLDPLRAVPQADMLLARHKGHAVAYAPGVVELPGNGHAPEKYAKFACSTQFAVNMARSQLSLGEAAPDSMLAFRLGGYIYTRRKSDAFTLLPDRLVSEWTACPGITVKTTIVPTADGHIRRHEIESAHACEAFDCGFAVQKFTEGYAEQLTDHRAAVRNAAGGCVVASVAGNGAACLMHPAPNTNLLHPSTEIPAVRYEIPIGSSVLETRITME